MLLSDAFNSSHLHYYARYVDDIMCVWQGSKHKLNDFHGSMNDLLNHLDLTVRLLPGPTGASLDFSVHRKSTFTWVSISHLRPHKMATVNAAIYRLLHLSLSAAVRANEIQAIQHIAQRNELYIDVLNKIITNLSKITIIPALIGSAFRI